MEDQRAAPDTPSGPGRKKPDHHFWRACELELTFEISKRNALSHARNKAAAVTGCGRPRRDVSLHNFICKAIGERWCDWQLAKVGRLSRRRRGARALRVNISLIQQTAYRSNRRYLLRGGSAPLLKHRMEYIRRWDVVFEGAWAATHGISCSLTCTVSLVQIGLQCKALRLFIICFKPNACACSLGKDLCSASASACESVSCAAPFWSRRYFCSRGMASWLRPTATGDMSRPDRGGSHSQHGFAAAFSQSTETVNIGSGAAVQPSLSYGSAEAPAGGASNAGAGVGRASI